MPEPQRAPGCRLHPAAEVRPSEIAGRGVFAATDLPARTIVLRGVRAEAGRVDTLGAAFPNHSCDPNLGWVDGSTLATMTDVPAGTELVTDYAMCIVETAWVLRCHCPSYRCRQMVEGSDWRIPQLQRRYDGWWAPAVGRLVEAAGQS